MNIYVCSCFEEKNPDIRITGYILLNLFKPDYIKVFYKDELYIMCPEIIDFCFRANKSYFFNRTCSAVSRDNFLSCYTCLRLEMKSICSTCVRPLSIKLFPHLSKI